MKRYNPQVDTTFTMSPMMIEAKNGDYYKVSERDELLEKVKAVLKDIAEGNGDNCKDCVYNAEQARQALKEIKQ
jgi:hypothetical protein